MKTVNYQSTCHFLLILGCMFFANNGTSQTFINASKEAGIHHAQVSSNLFGGGVAIIDYNNDGFEDIYLTGGTSDDKLYKNNGDGTFTDVSSEAQIGLSETVKTSGVISGDINNDGFADIFVTTESVRPNLLYMNQGDGTFKEVSAAAGIGGRAWSTGAAFSDYNQDGFLDIYVVNYIKEARMIRNEKNEVIGFEHSCYKNQFYINNADGTFTEAATALGLDHEGCGLAVTFTDYNLDGTPDIYIANDFGAWVASNVLYKNQYPQNNFEDQSEVSGLNCSIYGMGIGVGDINNDGKFDYYVTNLGKNVLYINDGSNTFIDVTDDMGVGNEFADEHYATSWGANIFDYDLDGYEDIFVSNGYTPSAEFIKTAVEDPNKLYRNSGNNLFEDVSVVAGVADNGISRGSATFDYDNDGDQDLIVTNLSRSLNATVNTLLYNNSHSSGYHWLKLKLEGKESNRSAFGAKAIIYTKNTVQIRELSGGAGHGSMSSGILHFGLADNDRVDSLKIIWPRGGVLMLKNLPVDKAYYLMEGEEEALVMGCSNDNDPNYNPDATYNTGCRQANVTAVINDRQPHNFHISPNPVTTGSLIHLNKEVGEGEVSLELFDSQGRRIFFKDRIADREKFSSSALGAGCYFYKVASDKRIVAVGRITIQ